MVELINYNVYKIQYIYWIYFNKPLKSQELDFNLLANILSSTMFSHNL